VRSTVAVHADKGLPVHCGCTCERLTTGPMRVHCVRAYIAIPCSGGA
jgi:hypothetical protein